MDSIINGGVLQLYSLQNQSPISFLIDIVSTKHELVCSDGIATLATVVLALPEQPYSRLHLNEAGVSFKTSSAPNFSTLLTIELLRQDVVEKDPIFKHLASDTSAVRIRTSYRKEKRTCESDTPHQTFGCFYLGVNHEQKLISIQISSNNNDFSCDRIPFQLKKQVNFFANRPIANATKVPTIKKWQFRRFINEGYLHLPQVIPKSFTTKTIKFLKHQLGTPGALIPGGVQGNQYGKFPSQANNHEFMKQLIQHDSIASIITDFLGDSSCQMNNLRAQIACRFPELVEDCCCTDDIGMCIA